VWKEEAAADPVGRATRDNEGWQGVGCITSCWVRVEVGSGARFGCCSRNHHFAWVIGGEEAVLFLSIYLDGQNVEDTCPQGSVSALVINDKRPFPMLEAPTQGRVL